MSNIIRVNQGEIMNEKEKINDPEIIDDVFIPFFSTKEEGSGIGLSLTRQIMNKHGGMIHIQSEQGKGCTVELRF